MITLLMKHIKIVSKCW